MIGVLVKCGKHNIGSMVLLDDLSGTGTLHGASSRANTLAQLITIIRHVKTSLFVCAHGITSVSPLIRDNADCIVMFRMSSPRQYRAAFNEFGFTKTYNEFLAVFEKHTHGQGVGKMPFIARTNQPGRFVVFSSRGHVIQRQ